MGQSGYTDASGLQIPYAIAFQGNVKTTNGESKTEIFVVDIDPEKVLADKAAVGLSGERPRPPRRIAQRRLTFTEKGLSDTRHWLRSSPDGKLIYALAKDEEGLNQIISADVLSGEIKWITNNPHSIDFSFNLDAGGERIAYIAQNKLYVFSFKKSKSTLIFEGTEKEEITGIPSFSPDGQWMIFNQYKMDKKGQLNLQIMKVAINK